MNNVYDIIFFGIYIKLKLWRKNNMGMFDKLLANLKNSRKTIVFTEGTDLRIL